LLHRENFAACQSDQVRPHRRAGLPLG
jgi:hypothetical protein